MTNMSGDLFESVRHRVRIRDDLRRCVLAEFFGTAIFVWTGTSVIAQTTLSRGRANDQMTVALCWGFALALGTFFAHRTSSGQLNPAISLFYLTTHRISVRRFFAYILAQLFGSFFGALLTFIVYYEALYTFGDNVLFVHGPFATANIFSTYANNVHLSIFGGFVDQTLSTAFFCAVVTAVTDHRMRVSSHTQLALIGASYALLSAAFGWQSGGVSANPARDFGGRLFSFFVGYGFKVFSNRSYMWWWVPIVAPCIGALAGGWAYILMIGSHTPNEIDDLEEKVREIQHDNNKRQNGKKINASDNNNNDAAATSIALKNKKEDSKFATFFQRNHKKQNDKLSDHDENARVVTKISSSSNSSINNSKNCVPPAISANRITLTDNDANIEDGPNRLLTQNETPRWHYSDLFADGNYVDMNDQNQLQN